MPGSLHRCRCAEFFCRGNFAVFRCKKMSVDGDNIYYLIYANIYIYIRIYIYISSNIQKIKGHHGGGMWRVKVRVLILV